MKQTKFAVVVGSLVAGLAASALALVGAGTLGMMLLSKSAASNPQFSTGAFLQQADLWM